MTGDIEKYARKWLSTNRTLSPGDICSDAEQLKGKPCDAWLCDEPLCNGADAPRSAGAAHVHTLAVVVLYFLVAG